jgi:hypothetical protein
MLGLGDGAVLDCLDSQTAIPKPHLLQADDKTIA